MRTLVRLEQWIRESAASDEVLGPARDSVTGEVLSCPLMIDTGAILNPSSLLLIRKPVVVAVLDESALSSRTKHCPELMEAVLVKNQILWSFSHIQALVGNTRTLIVKPILFTLEPKSWWSWSSRSPRFEIVEESAAEPPMKKRGWFSSFRDAAVPFQKNKRPKQTMYTSPPELAQFIRYSEEIASTLTAAFETLNATLLMTTDLVTFDPASLYTWTLQNMPLLQKLHDQDVVTLDVMFCIVTTKSKWTSHSPVHDWFDLVNWLLSKHRRSYKQFSWY